MQVLVVDDNDFIRKSLGAFLSKAGYSVHTAECGRSALGILGDYECPIDIVITDVMMPGTDGFDVVDEINNHRLIGRRIGLLAISGGGRTIDAKTALEALDGQVDGYLRKPFKQKELSEALSDVIEKHKLDEKPKKDEEKATDDAYWEL